MAQRQPEGPPPPAVVHRVRVHYAKRGRLRFSSHRDFARALERALRRAEVPIAFSAGFSPHPKISYVGAAPTGVSSEAEYLEPGLSQVLDPDEIRRRLDVALPDGLDIVEVVTAGPGSLAERIEASRWRIELAWVDSGVPADAAGITGAVEAFMAATTVPVQRLTKDGRRELDARAPVVALTVSILGTPNMPTVGTPNMPTVGTPNMPTAAESGSRAILDLVVRQATPSVRPDDVLAALSSLGAELPSEPPRATRLAQGPLHQDGTVGDPLATDRQVAVPAS